MKQKLTYLFSLMLLCILGTSGVLAENLVFSPANMTGQPADTDKGIAANNIWIGNGTGLNAENIIQITGNKTKGLSNQSTVTIGSTSYASFKNSNGAQMTITLPEGSLAYSVDFYVTTNASDGDAVLSEFEGNSCSDAVTSRQDGAHPTKISKTLSTAANSFTFTFGTKQVFFVAVVKDAPAAPEFTTDLSATSSARVGVAKTYTVVADGATSYQWYKTSSATADLDNDEPISGETNASYEYTATAEGTEYIYCAAINAAGTVPSTVCAVTAIVSSDDFNDSPISFSWTKGNETSATISGDGVEVTVMRNSVSVGSDLATAEKTYQANPNTMVQYQPGTSNAGNVEGVMIEYAVKTKKGITFTPTSVSYDAVKVGTDNAFFSWSYTVDGTESTITNVVKDDILRNSVTTGEPALNHVETVTGVENVREFTLRFYISNCANNKQIALSNININGVVNGTVEEYTTVYNLATAIAAYNTEHGKNIQGFADVLPPTTADEAANAFDLKVDATATNAKVGPNGDWAQINAGTVLTLMGVPEGATVTFDMYGSTGLTIKGVEYTSGQMFTSDKDQNLTMRCTTGGYIKTITIVGSAFVDVLDSEGYTNIWYFGESNTSEAFNLEQSPEYNYVVEGRSIVINTNSGKLNNVGRGDIWAQCNDGTLFKVPVYIGSKLSWGKFGTGSAAGFNINGQLFNDYYVSSEETTLELTAAGVQYLSMIKIEPSELLEITGTITGGDVDGATLKLTASNGQLYEATVASGAFTVNVPADTYAVELSDDVAYVVSTPTEVVISAAGSIGAITLVAAEPQTVTGIITNAPAEPFTLTFTGVNSHVGNVVCEANATSYTISLDPDTYTISSSVGTLSALSQESFKVVQQTATHNIYFPEVIPAATQQEIIVDNTATVAANVYNSVSDALAAAKAGSISAPIISLTSGQTYREQVIVDMANVTLKTTGTEKAKITFYYGIGYCYYSLNQNGYYDKDRAMTRNSKLVKHPDRWGCTVKVTNQGNNFKAENIIFENSFNQYYTNEEVVDGVEAHQLGDTQITYDRTLSPGDAGYKAADAKDVTERAAAIAFENNPTGCQVYDCVFIGSQDTYYTSGYVYAKNCDIQGNTDYIFGGGHIVFDNCNLVIGGYSDKETSAYITAQKGSSGDSYIFRDCTVTKTDRTYVKANLGRDWGGASATVYYFNLKNEIGNKLDYKWSNMGGGVSAGTANLHIYDFDQTVNANYSTTGSTGANINGLLDDADALDLYAGVVSFLGFTPERIYEDNLVLGDNSAYNICRIAASDGVERTVELTRSITAGNWSTIVLPFAMNETRLKEAFGENVKVAELVSGTESKLNFSYVTATEANKPYAIKVAAGDNYSGSATIGNVTVVNDTPTQAVDNWNFVGVYDVNVYMPVGSYFFTNNQIKKVVSENANKIKPFRAYFAYSGTNTQDAIDFSFDGDPTAIETLSEDDAKQIEGKFIVDGQLVVAKNGKLYNAAGAVIK